jgi:hypothetical protein
MIQGSSGRMAAIGKLRIGFAAAARGVRVHPLRVLFGKAPLPASADRKKAGK